MLGIGQDSCVRREGRRAQKGFSLVELMVVTAIVAILASVAIPAYVNHVNRARQSQAVVDLMNAKMEQEYYWEEGGRYRYAATIGCLPSFVASGNESCLTNCAGCLQTVYSTTGGYTYTIVAAQPAAAPQNYVIMGTRIVRPGASPDILIMRPDLKAPSNLSPGALKFSLFQYIFD